MSYNAKTYKIYGKSMQFNNELFEVCLRHYCRENHISIVEMSGEIAKETNVGDDMVRNWRKGLYEPGDLDMILSIEKILGLEAGRLLKDAGGGKDITKLSARQIEAVKKIYDALTEFIFEFYCNDGLGRLYSQYEKSGQDDPAEAAYDQIEKREESVRIVMEQEFFDLRGTEIYTELSDFANRDLIDSYNENIGLSERSKKALESSEEITNMEYCSMMAKLNAIIERHF